MEEELSRRGGWKGCHKALSTCRLWLLSLARFVLVPHSPSGGRNAGRSNLGFRLAVLLAHLKTFWYLMNF